MVAQSAFSGEAALMCHTIGENSWMRVAGLLLAGAATRSPYATAALKLAPPGNACSMIRISEKEAASDPECSETVAGYSVSELSVSE
jgi:hypothetical protein